ncbi:MAG: hypothetical protein V4557_07420 [Bacteroidota bacterium]
MKPNLFRSIYKALGEQFPLLPRIRRSFIGLTMFCLLFMVIGYSDEKGIILTVIPQENSQYNRSPVITYEKAEVKPGQLVITEPTFIQRTFLPNASTGMDMLTLFFIALASIIIVWMVPKLHQQNLFRKDISNATRSLGYLLLLYSFIHIYITGQYEPREIEAITHNEFTGFGKFPLIVISVEWYMALMLIALGRVYERGIKLQQEQDLTI